MDESYKIILMLGSTIAAILIYAGIMMKNLPIKTINASLKVPISPITRKAKVGEKVVCIEVDILPYGKNKYEVGDIGIVQQSEENFIVVLGWQDTLSHDKYVIVNKDWTEKDD